MPTSNTAPPAMIALVSTPIEPSATNTPMIRIT